MIFQLLDAMKSTRIRSNDETLEYVVNAVVVSVGSGSRASSMKDLPSNSEKIPEIVFAGRSNVGKSSLVNFLVNRKALAPTSSKPGTYSLTYSLTHLTTYSLTQVKQLVLTFI